VSGRFRRWKCYDDDNDDVVMVGESNVRDKMVVGDNDGSSTLSDDDGINVRDGG
jgi:hypothetical protein